MSSQPLHDRDARHLRQRVRPCLRAVPPAASPPAVPPAIPDAPWQPAGTRRCAPAHAWGRCHPRLPPRPVLHVQQHARRWWPAVGRREKRGQGRQNGWEKRDREIRGWKRKRDGREADRLCAAFHLGRRLALTSAHVARPVPQRFASILSLSCALDSIRLLFTNISTSCRNVFDW